MAVLYGYHGHLLFSSAIFIHVTHSLGGKLGHGRLTPLQYRVSLGSNAQHTCGTIIPHLLVAQGQDHIVQTGGDPHAGIAERIAACRAAILDMGTGNACQTNTTSQSYPTNGMETMQHRTAGPQPGCLNIFRIKTLVHILNTV